MVGPNELQSVHVALGNPFIIAFWESFPLDQILQLSLSPILPVPEDMFDLLFLFAIHDVWWGPGEVSTMCQCFMIGREERRMEDIMNLPGDWQLQLEHDGGDGLDDFEWAIALWVELRHVTQQFEMCGLEPHMIANLVLCCDQLGVLRHLGEGFTSFFSVINHFSYSALGCLVSHCGCS